MTQRSRRQRRTECGDLRPRPSLVSCPVASHALAVHSCVIVRAHIMGWWSTGSTRPRRSMARWRATARQRLTRIPEPRRTTARPGSATHCALVGHGEGRCGTGGHDAAKRVGEHKSPPLMSAQDWEAVDGSGTGTPRTCTRYSLRFATAAVVGPYGTTGYGSTVPVKNGVGVGHGY